MVAKIKDAAMEIYEAEKNRQPIDPFTDTDTAISVNDAYQIQLNYVEERKRNGATVKGKKIGLTSKAMQEMLGVDRPDYGHILDDMIFSEGTPIDADRFIAPRVEFEIAFVLKHSLKGPGITLEDVKQAIDYAVPAAELIDSRIKDWKIKFEDTVADNGSSAGAVFGKSKKSLEDLDLPNVEMTVYQNGEFLDQALGSAVLGNPLEAVVWLANALGEYDIALNAGEVILAGALAKAVPVQNGDTFKAEFGGLGTVTIEFGK
ncbi:2-keto-4-pentenoate hydratase [Oceanobacillus rekensis]|uniref:2-keto-4-pentenoate hydratase n=1 Tax=Oceanobacillus rekensis TaxID=937927 RepID=UPI000B44950F|nr:fumarylacetoacetate hydrolase family protein [Oceanobacillus rekensis]